MPLDLDEFIGSLMEGHEKNKQLNPNQRVAVCTLVAAGQSERSVARLFKVSDATVRYTIKHWKAHKNFDSMPKSGRPRKNAKGGGKGGADADTEGDLQQQGEDDTTMTGDTTAARVWDAAGHWFLEQFPGGIFNIPGFILGAFVHDFELFQVRLTFLRAYLRQTSRSPDEVRHTQYSHRTNTMPRESGISKVETKEILTQLINRLLVMRCFIGSTKSSPKVLEANEILVFYQY
ncbi:hypothetical protein V8F20_008207 [Naviculisporaceae sp. PSN 640]